MVQVNQESDKDPYEEIMEILLSYAEGLPPRSPDQEECSSIH